MVPRLQEIDSIVTDQIDDAVLLRQATGPDAGAKIFQRFRFADPGEGISQNRLDEVQRPQGDPSLRFHPIAQVFEKLRLKNGLST